MIFQIGAVVATLAALVLPIQGNAAPLFETGLGTGSSSRDVNDSIMTRIIVDAPVALTGIAVEMDLLTAGNIKFVIFDSTSGSLLFDSGSSAYADDGMAFKLSDPLAFTLNPGTTYALGAMVDVTSIQSYIVPGGTTQGSITSLGGNQNATGFALPVLHLALNGTDGVIQLYGTVDTPEPASAALMLAGIALIAARRRRRG